MPDPTSSLSAPQAQKLCPTCGQRKPLNEFYIRKSGTPYAYCKDCQKLRAKTQTFKPREVPGEPGEADVIAKLRSVGIYAAPGKSSEWRNLDVIAWGCVRIEVKFSSLSDGQFRFTITNRDKARWLRADVVILVCEWECEKTYHLLPSDHPAFYINGNLKGGASYAIAPQRRVHKDRVILTHSVMTTAMNDWGLIEAARQKVIGYLLDHPEHSDSEMLARPRVTGLYKVAHEGDPQQLALLPGEEREALEGES